MSSHPRATCVHACNLALRYIAHKQTCNKLCKPNQGTPNTQTYIRYPTTQAPTPRHRIYKTHKHTPLHTHHTQPHKGHGTPPTQISKLRYIVNKKTCNKSLKFNQRTQQPLHSCDRPGSHTLTNPNCQPYPTFKFSGNATVKIPRIPKNNTATPTAIPKIPPKTNPPNHSDPSTPTTTRPLHHANGLAHRLAQYLKSSYIEHPHKTNLARTRTSYELEPLDKHPTHTKKCLPPTIATTTPTPPRLAEGAAAAGPFAATSEDEAFIST